MESDSAYFRRRASEEDLAASQAAHFGAGAAHRERAARFKELAEAIEAQQREMREIESVKPESDAPPVERITLWL